MKRTALALALLTTPAAAQTQWYSPNGGATAVPLFVQGCLNASNQAVPVSSGACANNNGAASSTTSTANQGAAGTSPWPVFAGAYYSALPTLTSGNPAYVTLDQAGRVVLSPSSSVATQPLAGSGEQDVAETRTLNAATVGAQQTYTLNGQSTWSFTATGLTASGATLTFYQSNDWNGSVGTFTVVSEVNTGTGIPSTTRTTDGQSAVGVEGSKAVRVQVTTAGTGTITLASNISVRSRYAALRAPLPPGTNVIGKVGIDQTTPGTTNAVQVIATLPPFAAPPSVLAGVYNATLPTLTSGQAAQVALDSSGRLIQAPGATVLPGQFNTTLPTYATGAGTPIATDANGRLVNPSAAATAANQLAGTSVNGTAQTGGVAPLARLVSSAATTNATVAKASAGRVYRLFGCNTTTTTVYLKLYNTATAPTVGTTAVYLSRPFPASASAGALSCQAFDVADIGWGFSTGIAFALTTGNADSDATAPAAGAIVQLSVDGL